MTRRSKKKLTNRAKLLITVAIIAICLFIIHRFNFLTKSASSNETSIKFIESGTENFQSANLKFAEDADGKKYVILPEEVNGYFVEKFIITSENPISTYNNNVLLNNQENETEENQDLNSVQNTNSTNTSDNNTTNTTSNTNTNNIDTNTNTINTVSTNTTNTNTVENGVQENSNITNSISESETANSVNTNSTNTSNTTVSNNTVSNENEVEETSKALTTVSGIQELAVEDDLVQKLSVDNTNTVNETNTTTSGLTDDLVSETTKNIISNTVTTNVESETNTISNTTTNTTTNTISNEVENSVTNTNNQVSASQNTTIENDSNLTLDGATEEQEDSKTVLNATMEDVQDLVGLDGVFNDYKPGEKIYLEDDTITNNTATLEIVYQTKEINGVKLYNQKITSGEITITGYIPKDYYLSVTSVSSDDLLGKLSGLNEFKEASVLVGYDLKILDDAGNQYQPKDYQQGITVNVTSNTYLKGKMEGNSIEAIHFKETDTQEIIERIAIINETENSIEFITDEFSEYAVVAHPPITPDTVTIDDYKADYNYYKGLNYTSTMNGTDQGTYKDSNLAKVKINYYSYDYDKNLYGNNDLETTETWTYRNTSESGNYVNYTVRLVIDAPSGKSIDKNKSWFMTFDIPNADFSPEQTKTANGNKLAAVVTDDTTVTITGSNLSAWTENTAEKKYTIDLVLSFVRRTEIVILDPDTGAEITLDGLVDSETGEVIDPEPYEDPETGETIDPEPTVRKDEATGEIIDIATDEVLAIVEERVILYDLSKANNLEVIVNEKFLIGYVSVEEDERQVLFSYTKCLPITSGKVTFEVIDNPFIYRPAGYGFNGWVTHENYSFTFNNQTKMQSVTATVGANNEVTIDLYANWVPANIVFVNGSSGDDDNDGKTLNTALATLNEAADVIDANYKTIDKASNREVNIVVFVRGTATDWTVLDNGCAFTLTSAYNGVDYRNNARIHVRQNENLNNDVQLEYLNMHHNSRTNNGGYSHNSGTGDISYYIRGNTYNVRIGRGMVPINSDGNADNDATYRQIQGGSNGTSAPRSEYRLVVETGNYANLQVGRPNYWYNYKSNGNMILGNDYDRAKGDNTQFNVYHRIMGRTAAGRSTLANGKPSFNIVVKSGRIGMDCFEIRDDSYTYSGIYVGAMSSGSSYGEYSDRVLTVEGGEISNIIGGLGVSNGSSVKTRIYVKGGTVQNIVGGAGLTQTYGDRIVQVTGGEIAYSVSGGSNGWEATSNSSSGDNGRLTGDSLIYIGGNAVIGTNSTSSTLYGVNAGNVLGAGNGNARCKDYSGRLYAAHIIIDGEAQINNSVYGGGNYGIVGYSGAGDPSTEKADAANVVKIDMYGGTVENDIYGGANRANIEGSLRIVKEGGHVKGGIYGGSNTSGTVDGAALLYIQGGINGVEGNVKDIIFGGGKGASTKISQRTSVNISDLKNDLYLYGDSYGGSALGDVNGSTEVIVNDFADLATKVTITGNIYGGGKGDASNSADTKGNVTVTVDGGTYSGTSVFGGCNINGTIAGNLNVKIGNSAATRLNEVYGGGNQAQITTATNYVYVNLYKNASVVNAFNGGNSAGIAGTITQTPRYIKAIGATVGNLYGGSNVTGNLTQSFVYASDGATISNVYGGGYGQNAKITGKSFVEIKDSTIKENVYGGGNAGSVGGATDVDIYTTVVDGSVYAGGKGSTASVANNSVLDISDSTVWKNIYGGGNDGPVSKNTDINVVNTNVGECVYAGGQGETAIVSGNTLADITGSTIAQSVYGGGNAGQVVGNTDVNISTSLVDDCVYGGGKSANIATSNVDIKSSEITNNVYGGGEEGQVLTNSNTSTVVTMDDSFAGNVFGGGKGQSATVAGTTSIEISASTIHKQTDTQGNVYGGGDQGAVKGNTIINIIGDTTISDSVYGGGNAADVDGSTSVAVDESYVKGNVFGGGNAGAVFGKGIVGTSAAVSVLSSIVDKSVFGGGNQGEVTGNTSVIVSDISTNGTTNNSVVKENIYGGGNEADVNGTTVSVAKLTTAKNVYGGGNLGEVIEDTNVIIDNSIIENNVYGGGAGSSTAADGTKGQIGGNVTLNIRNDSQINNQVFGAGQGVTATVVGNVELNLQGNSTVTNDIYGGGDNGPVNGSTNVYISSGTIGGNAYAAGNGSSAKVLQNSYILAEGSTTIGKSIFGGGNAAETGTTITNADGTTTGSALTIVDIAGAVIGDNVYGGANSSVINGSTVTNIGIKAIDDYYGEEKGFEIGKIDIGGTVYGGGESMDPTKEFNYDSISVTETILINVDGEGYETSDSDTNTIDIAESIFGSGNASSAKTNGDINIRNYGTQADPKRGISIQRATNVLIDNVSLLLNGTTDSTSEFASDYFTLNRISSLKIKNNTTLYLVYGANLLAKFESMVGEDGNEEYATVDIIDTVIASDGNTYEVRNGNIYDNNGNLEYYVKSGAIYKPTSNAGDEDEKIADITGTERATKTDSLNVDNRIYMYSGRNLNISNSEYVTSEFGDVKGMTFFGIFKSSSSGDNSGTDSGNTDATTESSVFTGMYNPNYSVGGSVNWADRDFTRSYVLGLHQKNPEQDITKDGFYTVYEELTFELEDDQVLTEDIYDATSYMSYIDPTPEDDLYYMWYAGPDEEIFYYSINLIASKHSTLGSKELSLHGISYENATLTMTSFDATLVEGVGLYDKNDIPNINTDQEAANNNYALTMKTGNTGWSMVGATDFYANAITEDNNIVNAHYDGTNEYLIENLKTTPLFNFYFYNSNNITEKRDLGTCQINMKLEYWKDALNRGNAKVIIDIVLSSDIIDDLGYNGAITPGSQYDLFTTSVTNVTTKSSFSTYFELAQSDFMKIENVQKYYENSYRVFTTEYAFPEGTTITMIDRWNKNNPEYYYYAVTADDYKDRKVEYKFTDFKSMGSSNEPYDELEVRKNYYINDNNMDYQYENFIFIVNFENANFTDIVEGQALITKGQHFRIYLKADDPETGRTEILFGLLDTQIDSIVYGIYDTESTIELGASMNKKRAFLGSELLLKVDTIYNVKKGEQSVIIYDTRYFDKKLGIKLTLFKKNDEGVYELVNGANLLGTYFELNGERYYPRADGTTRIKIAELVSNASSTIKIGTENSTITTGEYQILIESFGSADGIYYGIEASDSTVVNVEIINDLYGLNSTLPENQVVIDKTTGYTLDDEGFISKEGENVLEFDIEYLSGLNNPYITVSLYRRNYDEGIENPYDNTYTKVDFADYVNEELEAPIEINQEYDASDESFVESIKQFDIEYKAIDTQTIKNAVSDNTVSITLNSNYTLKENLTSGTYKVVFSLYDASEEIAYKQETDDKGNITEKPFNITDYVHVGETFSYIIIK